MGSPSVSNNCAVPPWVILDFYRRVFANEVFRGNDGLLAWTTRGFLQFFASLDLGTSGKPL
jgi:hypothetical protein